MRSRTRRLAVIVSAALALSAPIPASTAAPALAPCRAEAVTTGSETALVLIGRFSENGAFDVWLTCHIMQEGQRVVSRTDEMEGPVAALASDERIPPGPFTVCYEVLMLKIWGYEHRTDC